MKARTKVHEEDKKKKEKSQEQIRIENREGEETYNLCRARRQGHGSASRNSKVL